MNDEAYMKLALELAERGRGRTSPNPMVGAVLVKEGKIIGQGWHRAYGGLHAEREALAACTESPQGADLYVTLEPCCHHGKQPPCVTAIIEAGIKRVVVGVRDPNPLVSGRGIEQLQRQGITVTEQVLEVECRQLNEVFFHYITTKRPFVVMKYAMTMDGKLAAYTGASKWITGEAARSYAMEQRQRYASIMVGLGTVLVDDPMLNCRTQEGAAANQEMNHAMNPAKNPAKNPVRIVCDSQLRTPLSSKLVRTARDIPTVLASCCTEQARCRPYEEQGCRILHCREKDGRVDLPSLMEQLGEAGIDSLLLEGGGTLNWAALADGIVQRVQVYLAPKLFGGAAAKTPVEGAGVPFPAEAFQLQNSRLLRLGEDFLIESKVATDVHRNC